MLKLKASLEVTIEMLQFVAVLENAANSGLYKSYSQSRAPHVTCLELRRCVSA